MKKYLVFAAAIALFSTSCEEDEVVKNEVVFDQSARTLQVTGVSLDSITVKNNTGNWIQPLNYLINVSSSTDTTTLDNVVEMDSIPHQREVTFRSPSPVNIYQDTISLYYSSTDSLVDQWLPVSGKNSL